MRGFFTNKDYSVKYAKPRKSDDNPQVVRNGAPRERRTFPENTDPCEICGLHTQCRSPRMPYTGQGNLGVFCLAEAPGAQEDETGTQLIGESGSRLRSELWDIGQYDLDQDFWKTNVLACRPPNNRTPSSREMQCCARNWRAAIEETHPKMIWLFGAVALEAFFAEHDVEKIPITSARRWCIPDRYTGAWVICHYHPAFVLRKNDRILDSVFHNDLHWALSCLHREPPTFPDTDSMVKCLYTFEDVHQLLLGVLNQWNLLVFDYETSSLKPYRAGNMIHTIGVCNQDNEAFAFPFQYPGHWNPRQYSVIKNLWIRILLAAHIRKVAHNIKFEHKWGRKILRAETVNWHRCTMNVAHLLDSRNGLTSLKIQAFLRYGIEDYQKEIRPFMKIDPNTGLNRMHECELPKLLKYNGLDALFERWLHRDQEKEWRRTTDLHNVYNEIVHDGLLALEDCEDSGFRADVGYYETQKIELTTQIDDAEEWLVTSSEAVRFEEHASRKINLKSTKDLRTLLYDILGNEPLKKTDSGNASVDEDTLSRLNSVFAQNLVKMRKLTKLRDTYLSQFLHEVVDGLIHPSYNLHIAATGRSSSSEPNFQNIPKRDEDAKRIIRMGIIPSVGHELVEADYKAIEVRVMTWYTHDPIMLDYVISGKDMHRDQAKAIFILDDVSLLTGRLRHIGKNGFVFPQFYGDWYKACAASCWEMMDGEHLSNGKDVRQHLKEQGIRNYQDFENHMATVEQQFWRLFQCTKDWRDWVVDEFVRLNYVSNFFGFRRTGYLAKNQIINSPVQGTASQCLQWSLNRLSKIRREEGWTTKICGQIHDSIIFDVRMEERDYVLDRVRQVMCDELKEQYPWIITPVEVDFSEGGVDRPWYYCGG